MTRVLSSLGAALGLTVLVASPVVAADDTKKGTDPKSDGRDACAQMMQGPGVTQDGRNAMRDFMRSDKAPQAMANMMEMARTMGNGDPMLGMTKMMEMMGGQGGMMGGSGSMEHGGMMGGQASPGPRQSR
jgi:hypothetical protein